MDYVDDILKENEEEGMRIDNEFNYSPTVCMVKYIKAENLQYILHSVGFNGLY
jgi:hypothetical protein